MFASKLFVPLFFITIFGFIDCQHDGFGFFEKIYELDKSLTPKEREQARAIGTNSSATKQEIVNELKAFFHGIGGETEKKFNDVAEMYQIKIAEIRQKIKENQSTLDDAEAKEIFKKAGEIHRNMNITFGEERKQLKSIFKDASPEVKRKIEHILWHSTKHHKTSNS